MTPSRMQKAGRSLRFAWLLATAAAIRMCAESAAAQIPAPSLTGHARSTAPEIVEAIQLHHLGLRMNDLNDAQTAVRNVLPWIKIYGLEASNTLVLRGTTDEIDTAKKLLAELDKASVYYRLTYTISDLDRAGGGASRSISIVVPAFGKGTLKRGKRVPISIGTIGTGTGKTTQFQYVDVGLLLEVNASNTGVHTKIEESTLAEGKSGVGVQDPVIQQTVLEGTSPLGSTKPIVLGTIELPGSAHPQQISVRAEVVSGDAQ